MQYTEKDRSIISQVAVKAANDRQCAGVATGDLLSEARHIRSIIVRLTDEPTEPPAAAAAPTDFAAEVDAPVDPVAAIQETFPGAQVVETPATAAAPVTVGQPVGVSENPPFDGMTKDKEQRAANAEWAAQRLAVRPDEFWDNRADKAAGTKKSTYPDFKHKDSGVGLWLS